MANGESMTHTGELDFDDWGRVGTIPGPDAQAYTEQYKAMDAARARNTGYACIKPYRAGDENVAVTLHDEIAGIVPTVGDLSSAAKIASALDAVTKYDMMRILSSHFPDTYIAWMQTLEATNISWLQ